MSMRLARQREEEAKAARQREASQIKVAEVIGRERDGFIHLWPYIHALTSHLKALTSHLKMNRCYE